MVKPYIDKLMKLVQQGLLEYALFQIYSETFENGDESIANDATALMCNLSKLRDEKLKGLIKYNTYNIQLNLIIHSTINLIRQLEKFEFDNQSPHFEFNQKNYE